MYFFLKVHSFFFNFCYILAGTALFDKKIPQYATFCKIMLIFALLLLKKS